MKWKNVNNLVVSRNYADYSAVVVEQNYHVVLNILESMHINAICNECDEKRNALELN